MNSNLPRWIVPILWILAAMDIVNGIEMFFFPSAWFFRLVPGVPETGPFNMHLVMDGGTFFLAVGAGLAACRLSKLNPREFIGSFGGETIASICADTDQGSDSGHR